MHVDLVSLKRLPSFSLSLGSESFSFELEESLDLVESVGLRSTLILIEERVVEAGLVGADADGLDQGLSVEIRGHVLAFPDLGRLRNLTTSGLSDGRAAVDNLLVESAALFVANHIVLVQRE